MLGSPGDFPLMYSTDTPTKTNMTMENPPFEDVIGIFVSRVTSAVQLSVNILPWGARNFRPISIFERLRDDLRSQVSPPKT